MKNHKSEESSKQSTRGSKRAGGAILLAGACLLSSILPAAGGDEDYYVPAGADEDSWKITLGAYGWLAAIQGETAGGADVDIDLSDILDNLDFMMMATAHASKGKWRIGADIITLQLSDDINAQVGPLNIGEVDLSSWVVTPTVSYRVAEGTWGDLSVLAGARYLWLKAKTNVNGPFGGSSFFSESGGNWDGIVGIHGNINLSERWFLEYYGDIGTGDSDSTWQVFAGIGYHLGNWDLVAGYRYLDWELDGSVLNDLNIGGPIIGATYTF